MKDYTRRVVAYIVARLITGKEVYTIYDYSASKKFGFEGKVTLSTVSVYDQEQKCAISGNER